MLRWNIGNDSAFVLFFCSFFSRVERRRWETECGRFRKNWRSCKRRATTLLRYKHVWPTALYKVTRRVTGVWLVDVLGIFIIYTDVENHTCSHYIRAWWFRLNFYSDSVEIIRSDSQWNNNGGMKSLFSAHPAGKSLSDGSISSFEWQHNPDTFLSPHHEAPLRYL